MESDSCKIEKELLTEDGEEAPEQIEYTSNGRNIFSTIRVRCDLLAAEYSYKFLLDYYKYFLPIVGCLFWLVLLLTK